MRTDSTIYRLCTGRASRVLDRLADAAAFIACLLLAFQVVAICLDVLLRLVLDKPLNGVTALTEWSLLYIAFLGAAWLQRENGHVRVDMIKNMLPRHLARGLDIVTLVIGLLVTSFLVGFGIWVTWIKMVEGEFDFFKLSWMPLFPIYAVIPFGAALWFLVLLRSIFLPPEFTQGTTDL